MMAGISAPLVVECPDMNPIANVVVLMTASRAAAATVLAVACVVGLPRGAQAHCDTLNGPVVAAARAALGANDIQPVLKKIRQEDEAEARRVFQQTMTVRMLNAAARDLADRYFFETIARLHRAGEGASFTGLKVSIDDGDEVCRISVADSGPGIPSAIRDQIFVPFFTTKSRGSGLGLPTAKRFVGAHRGRIGIECPPGAGTIVTIELPCAAGATV
jgi:light-regulated signal transduction histidine kinase (bacteriophytochrome)